MDIQAISSRSFSVYIPEEELKSLHLLAQSMTASDARSLVSSLIECDGPGAVNLELYPGRHDVLIFVSRSCGEPDFFSFPDIETLLAAAGSGIGRITSSLFWYNGAYILAVWPAEGHSAAYLREFASPIDNTGAYLLHLREHAKLICDGDALETLNTVFEGAKSSKDQ